MTVQIVQGNTSEAFSLFRKSRRPLTRNGEMVVNAQGFPVLGYRDGLSINSLLRKDEWEELDRAVIRMVKLRLNGIADLRGRGLVQRLGGLGTLVSQWNVASEKVEPKVSMDGRSRSERDRVEKNLYGVPVPIIHQEYEIGVRELDASRRLGDAIDTVEAEESAAAIAEKLESILFNGETSINVGGNTIYGYTNFPARDTDTASGYGGGDFSTITNIKPTFLGMLAALSAKRYHGPFGCYIADAQYHELLQNHTDGSGDTPLKRVLELPQIEFIKPSDMLSAGNLLMVQLTRNVVDLAEALSFSNREWTSNDEMALYFKVLEAAVPRLKKDYAGNTGIAHATGC